MSVSFATADLVCVHVCGLAHPRVALRHACDGTTEQALLSHDIITKVLVLKVHFVIYSLIPPFSTKKVEIFTSV